MELRTTYLRSLTTRASALTYGSAVSGPLPTWCESERQGSLKSLHTSTSLDARLVVNSQDQCGGKVLRHRRSERSKRLLLASRLKDKGLFRARASTLHAGLLAGTTSQLVPAIVVSKDAPRGIDSRHDLAPA